jgi:protein-tyrosine phosphatase
VSAQVLVAWLSLSGGGYDRSAYVRANQHTPPVTMQIRMQFCATGTPLVP